MTAVAVAPSPCYPADNIADVLLSAEHLAFLTDGTLEGSGARRSPLRGVVTDSREATEGCAFIALPGAITDGHRYVGDAARRGAALAIVTASWPATQPSPPLLLRVDDTAAALRRACSRRLAELGCVVLGITGSVGKTTFKEMCALVLPGGAHRLRVGKTVGNLNTWTGIPLSVLRLEEPVDVFVAELAMSARGEIADLCSFTHPRVGAVLNVGLAHVGLLGSREAIAEAKAELVEALPPDGEAV
ncbi:MAG TPA: Mur ligase family protein, partial [Candidatus Sulfotelmatobacter sp.]|nr:Mur ligase family protein [Candidatus Sulfotelmatobacter sp.]